MLYAVAMLPKHYLTSFILIIGLFISTSAHAEATYSSKKAQFESAYQQLMKNPGNLDLNIQYAEMAVALGDYEAAIPPLERILISNPDVPKIKLELGILYYLLGSYDVAKNYLQEAKQGASAQPEIQQQADDYLQRM